MELDLLRLELPLPCPGELRLLDHRVQLVVDDLIAAPGFSGDGLNSFIRLLSFNGELAFDGRGDSLYVIVCGVAVVGLFLSQLDDL